MNAMNIKVLTVWAIISFVTLSWCCVYLAFQHDDLMQRVELHAQALELLAEGQKILYKELHHE